MPVKYLGNTSQTLSNTILSIKSPEQYLSRIDPKITFFVNYYNSILYIRDFLEITYQYFPVHTTNSRDATRRIAAALSKGISGISYESEPYNSIEIEIFLGQLKILCNDVQNYCIMNKTAITNFSLSDGGIEISFTENGFDALQNFEKWDLAIMASKGKQKDFPFPINSEIIRLLNGSIFVQG
jgi:hypothetical protein